MAEGPNRPGILLGVGRFYHDPRGSLRAVKAGQPPEAKLLAYLMIGLVVILMGRLIALAGRVPPESEAFLPQAGAAVFSQLFVAPLFCYALAGIGALVAKLLKGQGSWQDGRMAFFWAILVSSPIIVISDIGAISAAAAIAPEVGPVFSQIGPVFFAWALSQCFAEAFGFTRPWAVFLTIAALVLVLLIAPIYILTN